MYKPVPFRVDSVFLFFLSLFVTYQLEVAAISHPPPATSACRNAAGRPSFLFSRAPSKQTAKVETTSQDQHEAITNTSHSMRSAHML